jgi:threonine dehydrogenase-like Zn-dependent dehydrogenase
MRTVRLCGGQLVVEDREPPRGDGVRVRVTSAGICGSDLHMLALQQDSAVLGHEFGGLLDDGTVVAVRPTVPCGTCAWCREGRESLCHDAVSRMYGATLDGGLADEVLVDPSCVVPVPAGVVPAAVALVEPLAVAVHAVNRAAVESGTSVAVIGGGTIGLLCAVVLLGRGCVVDVVARHPRQRAVAEALGAQVETHGRYAVVVDAAGTPASAADSVRLAERGGRVILVAIPWEPLPYPLALVLKEVDVLPAMTYGAPGGDSEFADAARLLGAHPELADLLVTHRFPLDEAAEAFRVAAQRSEGAIKVHLLP